MVTEVAVLVAAAKMKVAVVIDDGINNTYNIYIVLWSGQHNIYNDQLVIYFF